MGSLGTPDSTRNSQDSPDCSTHNHSSQDSKGLVDDDGRNTGSWNHTTKMCTTQLS